MDLIRGFYTVVHWMQYKVALWFDNNKLSGAPWKLVFWRVSISWTVFMFPNSCLKYAMKIHDWSIWCLQNLSWEHTQSNYHEKYSKKYLVIYLQQNCSDFYLQIEIFLVVIFKICWTLNFWFFSKTAEFTPLVILWPKRKIFMLSNQWLTLMKVPSPHNMLDLFAFLSIECDLIILSSCSPWNAGGAQNNWVSCYRWWLEFGWYSYYFHKAIVFCCVSATVTVS
jgi:hypothetical protein